MLAATSEVTEPTANDRSLNPISRIAGFLPWLAILTLTLSGLYVRLTFGRWPPLTVALIERFLGN